MRGGAVCVRERLGTVSNILKSLAKYRTLPLDRYFDLCPSMVDPSHNQPVLVAALYRFSRFERYREMKAPLAEYCCARGIRGTLILAKEGINGTVAGTS